MKPGGRLQEVFVEDFRKELAEIESPVARHVFILGKANQLMHLRIAEYVALIEASDITGHYAVGVLLETCLADVSCTLQGAICSAPDSEGWSLKHYSHIRVEAKLDALESIVKKQPKTNAPDQPNRRRKGSLQILYMGCRTEA